MVFKSEHYTAVTEDTIKPGSIIRGPFWPEPVEIKTLEYDGDFVHIVGATTVTRRHVDQDIPIDEFNSCEIIGTECACNEDPWKVFLSLESIRYRYASMYDPLLAMNISKVTPLPHQIEAVYGYVLKLPRIRFLIADDPGAGKTIMAGLIIKELKIRNQAKRILIVAPGHLKDQWRRELKERFEESFIVLDRHIMDSHFGENAWDRDNQIITSIDFAKQDSILPSLSASRFDLVIVDEAHKMTAYKYGEDVKKSERYILGECLSEITEHLLFLTATPHKGDPENFRLFLDLLEPGFFATDQMLKESIQNKDNPLFIRRIKEDLKNFEGEPIFLPRHVKTMTYNLGKQSPKEADLYNDLSEYVNTEYNKALSKEKKRNVTFALVILQRRFASSTYAVLRSLERRKKRLEELLSGAIERTKIPSNSLDMDEIDDMSEEDRWKEEELWETLSVAENREELQREIKIIERLIRQAQEIIHGEIEIKLNDFRETLLRLSKENPSAKDRKILVFTESRDTLDYLEQRIKQWGYKTCTIHGGMKLEERIASESIFRNESEVLIATEAAGEGINLQFCNLMINYDIPWNPNRLEQRMGRIHRYGQQKEVFIYNLVAEDTREGRVLQKLFEKLKEIRTAMGSDKVFDVISEVLYNTNLSALMADAAANARKIDEILKELDIVVDEKYISSVKENLGESLATRYIDYTQIKEMAQRAREYRLIPEYTEHFFKKAFTKASGNQKERKDGFLTIESIPFDIRQITEDSAFKKSYGVTLRKYPKVTFDKDKAFRNPDAEFISFGHPLFEAVMRWIESHFSDVLRSGACFLDPDGKLNGHILFYEGEIRDGKYEVAGKRLFAFYTDGSTVVPVSPALIWDLAEGKPGACKSVDVEPLKIMVSTEVRQQLLKYRGELQEERNRQGAIKKQYGEKSLEYLIYRLENKLIDYYDRRDHGENMDLAIRKAEEQKSMYTHALADLQKTLKMESSLTMSAPHFIGLIAVSPTPTVDPAMCSDANIELIGMNIAMEFELKEGREPIDVSAENLGFDIRSLQQDGTMRYIEVKARAQTGPVALTQNEWFKAQRFTHDYYLYAVMNAATNPELFIIQNPAETTVPEQRVEVVRYLIPVQEIKRNQPV